MQAQVHRSDDDIFGLRRTGILVRESLRFKVSDRRKPDERFPPGQSSLAQIIPSKIHSCRLDLLPIMPADQFLSLAIRHKCSTLQLRITLRKHAVPKDGSPNNASSSNQLFPPSMIQRNLTFESVQKIVNCSCEVCRPVNASEPFNDTRLINEIMEEPGSRIMLAILTHMGAGFATTLLHFHGLGRGNDFDIRAVFDRDPTSNGRSFKRFLSFPVRDPLRALMT